VFFDAFFKVFGNFISKGFADRFSFFTFASQLTHSVFLGVIAGKKTLFQTFVQTLKLATMKKMPPSPENLRGKKLKATMDVLKALAHPLRMQILQFIDQCKSANVNRIYGALRLEQSVTSQHLRILRAAGLVSTSRTGKFIHYSIDYDRVSEATKAVDEFLQEKKSEGKKDQ
jgi:ArsR family transcriptional regulator